MTDLLERKCKPCEGGVERLTAEQAGELMSALHPDWQLSASGEDISRAFRLAGFAKTIAFANAVAWVATTQGHHPEMTVNYGSCLVRYTKTATNGRADNDAFGGVTARAQIGDETKVENDHAAFPGHKHIRRLEVAAYLIGSVQDQYAFDKLR